MYALRSGVKCLMHVENFGTKFRLFNVRHVKYFSGPNFWKEHNHKKYYARYYSISGNDCLKKSNVWTIPNGLCISRIIASPIMGYYMLNESYNVSLAILITAGLTDLADGYIARNYKGQSSNIGTFLDPLADKVLIITLYASMSIMNIIPNSLMGIIILRDVLLLSAGFYLRFISLSHPRTIRKYFNCSNSKATLHPTMSSKINTVVQLITAVASIFAQTNSSITSEHLTYLWYTAGCTTIISGLSYIFSKNTYEL